MSRICEQLDEEVAAFRDRSLDHIEFPYVFVDATYLNGRKDHRVVSRAVVVATAVTAEGNREVLDLDIGDSEDEIFWTTFLRRLKERGLTGVLLVISDAHSGLKAAIAKTLIGATWQRCRVHTMRNLLAHVPKGHAEMVAATVRTIFAQPDAELARYGLHDGAVDAFWVGVGDERGLMGDLGCPVLVRVGVERNRRYPHRRPVPV